jgi:hypothetical protein
LEEDGKAWALNKSGDLVLNTNTDLTGYFSWGLTEANDKNQILPCRADGRNYSR